MMAARRGHGGPNSIDGGQGVSFADWVGASWRRRSDGRMAGQRAGCRRSGRKWQGATELGFPGPALRKM